LGLDDKFELTMGILNGLGAHTGLYHCKLIAQKWTYARQGPGRPRIAQEITGLV